MNITYPHKVMAYLTAEHREFLDAVAARQGQSGGASRTETIRRALDYYREYVHDSTVYADTVPVDFVVDLPGGRRRVGDRT